MKIINVAAAVFTDKEKIFVAKRKSDTYDKLWEFPGGKIEYGESPKEALIREIKEELNINIEAGGVLCRTSFLAKKELTIKIDFIKCTSDFKGMTLRNHYEYKWISSPLEVEEWAPGDIPALKQIFKK